MAASAIAVGAWRGFPVQDDTYVVRLLRLGGPTLVESQHADRPIAGFLISTVSRIAGEHRPLYIAVGLLGWMLLALEAALLWSRLFPEWSYAWPVISISVMSPVVTLVQFTTITTVFPCLLPVILVLAALLCLLGRPDAAAGAPARIGAALLALSAAVVSEYAIATVLAAATLLLFQRRWRGIVTLLGGVFVGYVVYRAISDVTLRMTTNPQVQLRVLLQGSGSFPFRLLSATWQSTIGSWSAVASEMHVEWDSKSTLVALAIGLVSATGAAVALRPLASSGQGPRAAGPRLAALVAAVFVGLSPIFAIWDFPLTRVFETRYYLPVLVFSTCAVVGGLLSLTRARFAPLVIFAVVFLSTNRLVLRSVEEGKLQRMLERFGESVRPYVGREPGIVVLVSPTGARISPEETMAKATFRWAFPEAGRLWIVRPDNAEKMLGPRSSCRSGDELRLDAQRIRWPRPAEPFRRVLWDSSHSDEADPEPYFRGCAP